ncbi:MAG TPA: hypothetical protein VMX56_02920 [Anaerolineales bacterium]|nr:hypothetical protein [Anaerolineales bacterium]
MRRIPPALFLFFLAPTIGELLSGSAPPVEFFNPFALLILSALYGSGAVLVRELALRWNRRWPTILTLGLAYGIIEEGLMVKSFFDPSWMDLGILGTYGRLAGVNWVWSVSLTLYHATVSIAIPILLTELIYTDRRDEHWTSRRGLIGLSFLLAAVVLFGALAMTTYRPPIVPYLCAFIATVVLYGLACRMPQRFASPDMAPRLRPFWIAMIGFLSVAAFFMIGWALPELDVPPVITIGILIILAVGGMRLLRWASGEGAWSDVGRLALASGALTFFIILAFIAENSSDRTDNPAGMAFVGLTAAVGLLALNLRVRRRVKEEKRVETIS